MVATHLSCLWLKHLAFGSDERKIMCILKFKTTFYSHVFPHWCRRSKCRDKSFHTSRAGRPALRQQNLFDAGVLLREWNSGFADLLLSLPFYIHTLSHSRLKPHSHIDLNSTLKTHNLQSQGLVCNSGLKARTTFDWLPQGYKLANRLKWSCEAMLTLNTCSYWRPSCLWWFLSAEM